MPPTCCLLRLTCYKSATEPRFSTQRDHSAQTARLTRLGCPAQSGSGFTPSVASRACGRSLEHSLHSLHCLLLPVLCTAQIQTRTAEPEAQLPAALAVGWRQIHLGGCYPLAPIEISPMGGNGVSLSRQIDSLQRCSLGSSCPGPRVNAGNPPSQTPEDPSVRLVWDLPQSVRSQTLLQDNPSLESGRPSLGLSAHSSIPEPPPAAALASPTRRVNLSLPPPV